MNQPVAIQFKDGSGNPLAGKNVLLFGAAEGSLTAANALDGGSTDSNGIFLTSSLAPGALYQYTSSAASPMNAGTFFLDFNDALIVLDPLHNTGSYPGTGTSAPTSTSLMFGASFSGTFDALAFLTGLADHSGGTTFGPSFGSVLHRVTTTLSNSGTVTVGFSSVPNALNSANSNIASLHVVYDVNINFTGTPNATGTFPGAASLLFHVSNYNSTNAGARADILCVAATGNAWNTGARVTLHEEIEAGSNTDPLNALGFYVAPSDPNGVLTGCTLSVNVLGLITPVFA